MSTNKSQTTVTRKRPCRHCGKTDWCYYFPDSGLEVCNRGSIATGWLASNKQDANGNPYLYEEEAPKAKPKIVSTKRFLYTDREGQPLARVCRHNFDDGSKKPFRQGLKNGRWVNSCKHIPRENIPIYRYVEIQKAIADGLQIFWVEGEKCADILWLLGIPATTNFGGSGQLKESDLLDLEGANLVICPDRDEPGIKLAEKVYEYYPHSAWLYAFPEHQAWSKETLPKSDGVDIWDWITEKKLTAENIYGAVEMYRGDFRPDQTPLMAPEAEQLFTEKAIDALYSQGHYISLEEDLYKFTGKYYEKLSPRREQRRIADWCRSNPVSIGANRWSFKYASPATVNSIWAWLLIRFGVDPTEIDPPGLNLNNGILQTEATKKSANAELIPHSPDYFYTYCVEVDYNPKADPFDADRLLQCLDEGQRLILLRTLAASLNLAKVRANGGRAVKGLLLHGEGNNGKDSLRTVMKILFGESMVNVSMSDFQSYDQGRKFPLAKLSHSRLSWSSENTKFASLENSSSLKAAITGDPIDIEQKNQSEYTIEPETIFLFNCNEPPSLIGGTEAILSRWSIVTFDKVYKKNADIRHGEIEADPRFRYDSEFLRKNVVPAFLNKILEQFPLLLRDGIDYSPTKEAFKELQEENNHLWGFVRDMGVVEKPGEKLYIKDMWNDLREWYKVTGTMEVFDDGYGKEKVVWHDQNNPYDKTLKASNQIFTAFKKIFPKIKKMREKVDLAHKGQWYLLGITKIASLASLSVTEQNTASLRPHCSEAVSESVTQSQQASEVSEAICLYSASHEKLLHEVIKRLSYFSPEMRQNLIEELHNVNSNLPGNLPSQVPNQYIGEPKKVKFKGEIFSVKKMVGSQLVLTYPGQNKTICMPDISKCEILE